MAPTTLPERDITRLEEEMTTDFGAETAISLAAAARLLPGRRGHASVRTVVRYAMEGVRVNGRTVRLRSWRVGGMRRTSREAIDAFVRDCNLAAPLQSTAPRDRREAAETAAKALDAAGI